MPMRALKNCFRREEKTVRFLLIYGQESFYIEKREDSIMQENQMSSAQKRSAVALGLFIIVLSIAMMAVIGLSIHSEASDEDLVQISTSFSSYEIKNRSKSLSYDLLLTSQEHDRPFKMNFFDGYKGIIEPEELCSGSVYSLEVLPAKSSYVIYSCFDEGGNLIMTKQQAYHASQNTAGIVLMVMFTACICVGGLYILIAFRPEWFSKKMRKSLMGTLGK